jgi:uncharacterized membrane protein
MTHVQHLTVTIQRPPTAVYEFAADPRNLPRWAAGLAQSSIECVDGQWLVDAPFGRARVTFAPRNDFGVLDHDVTLINADGSEGATFHNPMRVLPHGAGSEFVFTLFRQPDATDEQFAADRAAIERDLQTLKHLLETP